MVADFKQLSDSFMCTLHCVSKKFPPFNCLLLCQILTDFQGVRLFIFEKELFFAILEYISFNFLCVFTNVI